MSQHVTRVCGVNRMNNEMFKQQASLFVVLATCGYLGFSGRGKHGTL